MEPSWSTATGCSESVFSMYLCVELLDFTNWACAEARSVTKRGRDSSAESSSSPDRPASSPFSPKHRTPDDDPPARKAARAVTAAMQDESSPVGTSAAVSVTQYSALPASGR